MARADHVAVVDLEATCADTANGDDSLPPDQMEIIEIGAVMLRRVDLAPVDTFERFVHPVVHHRLTPFCIQLTGITQHDVDAAAQFPEVFWRFCEWLTHWQAAAWGSWGNWDAYQLRTDARRHEIAHELTTGLPAHCNLKKWWRDCRGGKRVSQRRAVEQAGLEWTGRQHRGIDDARMLAELVRVVGWPAEPQGAELRGMSANANPGAERRPSRG